MSLRLLPLSASIGLGRTKSFIGSGGSGGYVYSVVPGGAGGVIDPNGYYSAPPVANENPAKTYDTIKVTDSSNATATTRVLVCTNEQLVLDIIRREMDLQNDHCYLWDQKIPEPSDFGLYVVISVLSCKPYANISKQDFDVSGNPYLYQQTNFQATLSIDIMSRGPAARDRKEQIIMALKSYYSISQQEANSFRIAGLSSNFTNLSNLDGSAIPYRYNISVNILYAVKKYSGEEYFDKFSGPELLVNQ